MTMLDGSKLECRNKNIKWSIRLAMNVRFLDKAAAVRLFPSVPPRFSAKCLQSGLSCCTPLLRDDTPAGGGSLRGQRQANEPPIDAMDELGACGFMVDLQNPRHCLSARFHG